MVALKLAVVAPAATVTEVGTVSAVVVLVRATESPPTGAARLSVKVQVFDAFGPMLPVVQVSVEGIVVPTTAHPKAECAVNKRAAVSKGAKLFFKGSFFHSSKGN